MTMKKLTKKTVKKPVTKKTHGAVLPPGAPDYLEIQIEIVGCNRWQKVGGKVGLRTSDSNLLPRSSNKKDIQEAVDNLWITIRESIQEIGMNVVETVESLADTFEELNTKNGRL